MGFIFLVFLQGAVTNRTWYEPILWAHLSERLLIFKHFVIAQGAEEGQGLRIWLPLFVS